MSTKPSSPELRPNRYDALVVLVVLALAAALAVRPFLAARAPQSGALTVVVSADGQEQRLHADGHGDGRRGVGHAERLPGAGLRPLRRGLPRGAEHRVPARAHRGGAGRRRRRLRPRDGLGGAV